MVEIFFGIITRQAIRRGTFTSVKDLIAAIGTFIDGWNDRCHPFVWTKTAAKRPAPTPESVGAALLQPCKWLRIRGAPQRKPSYDMPGGRPRQLRTNGSPYLSDASRPSPNDTELSNRLFPRHQIGPAVATPPAWTLLRLRRSHRRHHPRRRRHHLRTQPRLRPGKHHPRSDRCHRADYL